MLKIFFWLPGKNTGSSSIAEALNISVEHYRKLESGAYGLLPEKMLELYKRYKIDPTYLITGEKGESLDIEMFLANCRREEREDFLDRVFAYLRKMIK